MGITGTELVDVLLTDRDVLKNEVNNNLCASRAQKQCGH